MRVPTPLRASALALAATLLAACGSDSSGSGPSEDADAAGEPRSGGTATLIQHGEPRSLDPAAMLTATSGNTLVGNSLYGQLILTESSQTSAEPGLAESLKTEDGGTNWTLVLRDGLTFSDGTPLDAAAVQFNWKIGRAHV